MPTVDDARQLVPMGRLVRGHCFRRRRFLRDVQQVAARSLQCESVALCSIAACGRPVGPEDLRRLSEDGVCDVARDFENAATRCCWRDSRLAQCGEKTPAVPRI